MKDKRRLFEKYGGHYEGFILKRKTKVIGELLEWLESHISETEAIDIHEWFNERYYIVIKDIRDGWNYPENCRIGLTVDIDKDTILWSNNKGNCFVRGIRWKRLVGIRFGKIKRDIFRWYGNTTYPKKEVKP